MGAYKEAIKAASAYRDIFGKETSSLRLWITELRLKLRVKADLMKLGKELGLPLLATNDLHYTRQEDAGAH